LDPLFSPLIVFLGISWGGLNISVPPPLPTLMTCGAFFSLVSHACNSPTLSVLFHFDRACLLFQLAQPSLALVYGPSPLSLLFVCIFLVRHVPPFAPLHFLLADPFFFFQAPLSLPPTGSHLSPPTAPCLGTEFTPVLSFLHAPPSLSPYLHRIFLRSSPSYWFSVHPLEVPKRTLLKNRLLSLSFFIFSL